MESSQRSHAKARLVTSVSMAKYQQKLFKGGEVCFVSWFLGDFIFYYGGEAWRWVHEVVTSHDGERGKGKQSQQGRITHCSDLLPWPQPHLLKGSSAFRTAL